MNVEESDPTCTKLQNSDILKDLDKKPSHLDQTQLDELKMLILENKHVLLIFEHGLIKFIMMLILKVQNQWNNIHIEWTSWNRSISERKFSIYWTMTLLSLVKVIRVLLAFLCQNLIEHFLCSLTIDACILWLKQRPFHCREQTTVLTTLVMQYM